MTDDAQVRQDITLVGVDGSRWTTDMSVENTLVILDAITAGEGPLNLGFPNGVVWHLNARNIVGAQVTDHEEEVNLEVRRPRTPPAKSRGGSR